MDNHWVMTENRFPLLTCLEGGARIYVAMRQGKESSTGDFVEGEHFAIEYSSGRRYMHTLASFGEEERAVDEIKGIAKWLGARSIRSVV